jgi:cytochrome c oxidase subunit II
MTRQGWHRPSGEATVKGPMSSRFTPTISGAALRRHGTRLLGLGLLALTAASCAEDKPLNTFEPRGPKARLIDSLMAPIWWVMVVIFFLVIGGTIVLAIKNRVKDEDFDPEDLPPQTHGNTPLELAWTLAPAVLLAAIAIPVVGRIWDLEERNDDCGVGEVGQGCDGLDVMVVGQQWWWEFRYDVDGDGFFVDGNQDGVVDELDRELPLDLILDPDDVVTANELVMPAGEQIDLILTSRDVIHSFWIPRLNGKRDTVPGRFHTWTLQADEPGKYTGWCTEFCGLSHARMRMSAIALSADDYQAWWDNQVKPAEVPATGTEAAAGRELFMNNCQRCHVVTDGDMARTEQVGLVSGAAPNLTHFATRTTFAGGIYGVYAGGPGDATVASDDALPVDDVYVDMAQLAADPGSVEDYRFNSAELKRWISNAPGRKDMASEPNPDTGLARGMPAFPDLSDQQLDQIVAYLATLD